MKKIMVILSKEWLEIRQQRLLLFSILLPPLIFSLLPLGVIYSIGLTGANSTNSNMPSGLNNLTVLAGMSPKEVVEALIGMQLSNLFLLLPGIITSIVASYSIVGEKTSRTLEPLLATPIRTWELLLGKSLASLLPGVGVTWLSGLIFIIGVYLLTASQRVFLAIVSPGWLILFLVWAPLLSLIAIAVMIAISSRVNDPRTAQQLSVWIVVPFLGVFIGQAAGLQVLGPVFTLIVAAVLAVIALVAMWGTTILFQREVILTRWK